MPFSYGQPIALKSTGTESGPTPPVFDASREQEYRGWIDRLGMTKKNGFAIDDDYNGTDYDLRGFYDKYGPVNVDVAGGQHFTDEFKLPNHATFSNESRYAVGANASRAGHWENDQFVPPGQESQTTMTVGLQYGKPLSLKNPDDTNPPPENPVTPDGVWVNTLDDREKATLKRWYSMPWIERKVMPEPDVLRVTRQRRDQAVGAQEMQEDPWSTTLGKVFENAPRQLRMQFAGIFRSGAAPISRQTLSDNAFMTGSAGIKPYTPGAADPKSAPANYQLAAAFGFTKNTVPPGTDPVDAFAQYLDTPEGQADAKRAATETPIALKAQEWWDQDTGKLKENMPFVRPHSMKYYAAGTLESVINMGPAVAATLVTKNPQVGLAIMGSQVYGETYGQLKDAGYSHDQAVAGALFSASVQTLTEGIPLGILTSNKFLGLRKILAASGAESVQNTLQEALQMGYDTGVLNQDMTMGEAAWRLVDAGLIGFAAGGAFGSAAVAVDKLRTPAGQELAQDQQHLDAMADRIAERSTDLDRASRGKADAADLQTIAEGGELPAARLQELVNQGYIKLEGGQAPGYVPRGTSVENPDAGQEATKTPATVSGPVNAPEVPVAAVPQTPVLLPTGRRRITTALQDAEQADLRSNLAAQGVRPQDMRPTVELIQKPVQAATAEAQTAEPTEAQKTAGNYRKGRFKWNGREIAIETPAGAARTGVDEFGQPWSQELSAGYGYFVGKPGADHVEGKPTEGIDAYVGPDTTYPMAYVINQTNADGSFDEHKVMVGYRSAAAAMQAYRENFAPARGKAVSYVTMPPDQFKAWLDTSDHRLPAERTKTVPTFRTHDETIPTSEKYTLRGNRPVGAPPAVKTLDDVDGQIDDFVRVLEDSQLIPEQAWTWYEDSGQAIRDVTQGDPARMHDVVKVLAVLSQASGVATNTGAMVKAAYEIAKGNKAPKVGRYPNAMAKNIETVLNAPEVTADLPGIGEKLASFYRNLYDATFNTRKFDQDVTIDRWMARIMKYRGDTVLGTQYKYARKVFGDAVARFNARNGTDWLPRNAQAALWVHERSRTSMEKTGKPMPVDAFSSHLDAAKARVIHEAVPSTKTPAGKVIASLDNDAKSDYTRKAIGHYVKGEKNALMEELGIPLYKGTPGSGGYESLISPNEISNVVMLKGGEGYDRATADTVARAYMLMHSQDAVPWFRADRNANTNSKKFSQGVEIQFDHELAPDDEQKIFKQLQLELGMFAGYTKTSPNAITVVDFKNEQGKTTSGKSPQEFVEAMERAADAVHDEIPVKKIDKFGAEGNYLTHDWESDPNGEALQAEIASYAKARQRPDLLERVRDWREQIRRTSEDFASKASKQRSVAEPVPMDRLDGGSESEHEIYGRFGKLAAGRDTTKQLKFYDLGRLVDNPQITTDLLANLGFHAEVFSFEPDNFRIPKLGKENYKNGVVWIYDPAAAHGSFKDTNYTKAWRETHEAGHGVVEPLVHEKYGPSRRYGRLGRTMIGERGAPPKRTKVELKPLTLKEAQRSIEWEDAAFRAQRMLLEDVGVKVDDATFNREFNTNISDAMYRVVTGDFGNPGEVGFMPSAERAKVRDVLEALQMTEEQIAAEQGRAPTEGINLEQWQPIDDKQIRAMIDAHRRRPVMAHVAETVHVPRAESLSERARGIEDRMAAIVGSFDVARADYARLGESAHGKILNTDVARELSPDYLADRTQSAAVHEPASWFVKKLYATMLQEPPPMGTEREVLFTGGGTGAGKTSGIAQLAEARTALGRAHIIFDTNLNNYESSVAKIEQALSAGHKVNILYTWRDPVEAFANGTLKRSMRQEQEFGSGRTVPLAVHAETHSEGYDTIGRLEDRYRGNPDVAIRIIDNSRGPGNAVLLSSIRDVKGTNTEYNSLVGKLHEELEQQFAAGRISQPVYQATLGRQGAVPEAGERAGGRGAEEPQPAAAGAPHAVTPLRGVDPKLLKQLADEFVAAHPHAPSVTVVSRRDLAPPEIAEYLRHAPPQGVDALFYPAPEGARMYLFADQFKSTRDAVVAMYHEGVGHYGLKSVLGSDWAETMDKIATAMPEQVARAALRNNLDVKDEYERLVAAEEMVAYRAEQVLTDGKMPSESWFSNLIDRIKIAVARLRGIQMTDTEVMRLIRKARMFVAAPWGARMGARRVTSPPVMHSRLWNALNDVRVKDKGDYSYYGKEVWAQIRNGNIAKEDADPVLDWITSRAGEIQKADLLEVVRGLGNQEAIEPDQYDGRRRAVFHGNLDDGFTLDEGSKTQRLWNLLVYKMQDKFVDLLETQKAIEQQTGRKLSPELDAYLAEELYHGKVKDRVDRYDREYVQPLVKMMKESGYTWDEVEWFLYARHAPEANEQLYKINWGTPEMVRRAKRAKERAEEKYSKREAVLEQQRAKARVRFQSEHEANVRVAEAEHKAAMRRVPKTQVEHPGTPRYRKSPIPEINEARQKKIDRSAARLAKQIDALEGRIKLQRDEYRSILGAELEQAQFNLSEAARERKQQDPGLLALSGMSDAEAADIMDVLGQKADIRKLHAIGEHIDRMTKANREAMVDAGLETPETIKAWESTYKYYVPLKGWKDGAGNTTYFPKKGRGFDTGGKLQQRRLGRRSLAANILANVVAQAQSTAIMAEKAKVGRTFLNLAQQNPSDLWTVNQIESRKSIDRKTGLVVTGHDPTYKLADNVFRVKVEGKDYHVTFNEESAPAMRMAKAMKNLGAEQMNYFFRTLLSLNRILSAVNTGYNPEFVVSNLARDIQTAAINMTSNEADSVKAKIFRDMFQAHQGIRRGLGMMSFRDVGKPDPWREAFEDYKHQGAMVGWLDNYRDVMDLEKKLKRDMANRDAGLVSWATIDKAKNIIEGENQAIENAIRLSTYKNLVDNGIDKPRAASISKNLTVNFNRKGDIGTAMNALYLFYNASIQGMAVAWKAAKSPKTRKIMYGVVAFAAAMDILNRIMGGQDDDGENRYDKVPEYVKDHNLVIMLPEQYSRGATKFDDHYITIPLPYGYNFLHAMGRAIGGNFDYYMLGNKRKNDVIGDIGQIMSSALNAFNPIGTGPTFLQTVTPTVMTPLVQSAENVSWYGGPVVPPQDPWDPSQLPDSQRYFESAKAHDIELAKFLNELGGGTEARPAKVSFLDISPQTIALWEDFLTGGAGKFLSNMVELGVMAKTGESETKNIPFVRRLVGHGDRRQVTDAFYANRTEVSYATDEVASALKKVAIARTPADKEDARAYVRQVQTRYRDELTMAPVMQVLENQLKDLNHLRKAVKESDRPDKDAEVQKIELQKAELMNKFNRKYNELKDRSRGKPALANIFPFIAGARDKHDAASSLQAAGMPAAAELINALPARLSQDQQQQLQRAGQ